MAQSVSLTEWIREHGLVLSSLDLDAPVEELEPVLGMVGDARVVAIGESSHHVREFFQLRHRLLRFLVERCGFTVYALEAPFTEGRALADWLHGGPGAVETVTAAGIALSLGDAPEVYEALAWLRSHNQRRPDSPVRYAGADVPGSLGSPLPALEEVSTYLRDIDSDALVPLGRARAVAEKFHQDLPFATMMAYSAVSEPDRETLTAALSELLARMERLASRQRSLGRAARHVLATHHLRGAWYIDQLHRAQLTEGIEVASTFRDLYMAETVLRLLAETPGSRIVLAAHNWHIQRAPAKHVSGADLFPAGYHLAAALGDDYRAIGVTAGHGHTAVSDVEALAQGAFPFREAPLPPPEDDTLEAAFPLDRMCTIADLRAASVTVADAAAYRRMRMADYFLDQPAFHAYDAVALVSETHGSARTRCQ
ncbi:erythromycin esterase family protein [Micromonospora sp. KC606]|uniref:erythromycin esterase family protein n=1 Tax=Micromonospora sp. KC606 TaxID=2530379 RepID=UPI0010501942|nr:erythromycin esterase family protein [Micromonospora sp. KC606]TDC80761.1 erythromycin esterase family protein [Micromonospora sp. KC606]